MFKLLNTLLTILVMFVGFVFAGWVGAIVLGVVYIVGMDILGEIWSCITGNGECGGQA